MFALKDESYLRQTLQRQSATLHQAAVSYAVSVIIIRWHRSTTYVDAAYCYRLSSVVCLYVCQSVGQSVLSLSH